MGAKKSHKLPPAACRLETQKSSWCSSKAQEPENLWCRFQSDSEGLRVRSVQARGRAMSQLKQSGRERTHFPFLLLRPSMEWGVLAHSGEGHLFHSVHKLTC